MRVDLVAVDLGRVDHVHERNPCHETADNLKLTLLSHDLVLCFATPVFSPRPPYSMKSTQVLVLIKVVLNT